MPADRDEAFWSHALPSQPFYVSGLSYADYAPALALGRARWRDDTLVDDVLARLGGEWEELKGSSRLAWFEACHAVRAAWEHRDRLQRQSTVKSTVRS